MKRWVDMFPSLRALCVLLLMHAACVLGVAPALAGSHGAVGSRPLQSLQLWGGGQMDKLEIALNTGVTFIQGDGNNGFYILGGDGAWHQQVTDVNMQQAGCNVVASGSSTVGTCFGMVGTGASQVSALTGTQGVIDMCGSPANSQVAYAMVYGYVMVSTNVDPLHPDDIRWINSNQISGNGFAHVTDGANSANRSDGNAIACDPNNANHVFVWTHTGGLFQSVDGGSHFTQVASSDVPFATGTNEGLLAFDPQSGVNGSGLTNTICAYTNGAPAGVYCSTTGGGPGTWSLSAGTGAPTTMQHIVFSPSGSGHALWGTTGANLSGSGANVVSVTPTGGSYATSPWNIQSTGSATMHWVTLDNHNRIVATGLTAGNLFSGTWADNGTATWGSTQAIAQPMPAGDSAWLAGISSALSNTYAIELDPLGSGALRLNGGQGHFTSTYAASGNLFWTANVRGVMHPTSGAMASPGPLVAVSGSQDIAGCAFLFPNGLPAPQCHALSRAVSLTFASGIGVSRADNCFLVEKISPDFAGTEDFSGYSVGCDNFQNPSNYAPFNTGWSAVIPGGNVSASSVAGFVNNVKVSLAGTGQTTTSLSVFAAGANGSSGTILCAFSNQLGAGNIALNLHPDCERVVDIPDNQTLILSGTCASSCGAERAISSFTLYAPSLTSLRRQTTNITGVGNSGGKIAVTIMDDRAGVVPTSGLACITGVQGAPQANGCWPVNSTTAGTMTVILDGSNAAILGAYTQGGEMRIFVQPGGGIAAASDQSIVVAPANGDYPQCSANGGKAWADFVHGAEMKGVTYVTGGPYSGGAGSFTVNDKTKLPGVGSQIWIPMDDGRLMEVLVGANPIATTLAISSSNVLTFANTQLQAFIANGMSVTDADSDIPGGTTVVSQAIVGGKLQVTVSATITSMPSGDLITFGSFAANTVFIQGASGIINAVPSGRTVSAGSTTNLNVITDFGWEVADFDFGSTVTADYVQPNFYYLVNRIGGLFAWPGCGAPVQVNQDVASTGTWQAGGGANSLIKAVPGQAGHFMFGVGPSEATSGANEISGFKLWRSCNGVNITPASPGNNTTTMVAIDGVFGVWTFGFGAAKANGSGYPSIYFVGYYDAVDPPGSKSITNAVFGIWESTDDPNSGNTGPTAACVGTGQTGGAYSQNAGSFHKIADWPQMLPGGPHWMANYSDINGDPYVYGAISAITNNGPVFLTLQNFLLNRDLPGHANDNRPAFLDREAA